MSAYNVAFVFLLRANPKLYYCKAVVKGFRTYTMVVSDKSSCLEQIQLEINFTCSGFCKKISTGTLRNISAVCVKST